MKQAVAHLVPYIEEEKRQLQASGADVRSKGKIVIATVKGDVHDIGKNIVTVVLQCNNFEVVNMGVMVPCKDILEKAKEVGADIIGLSGLITPSLEEMRYVAAEMERDEYLRSRQIPLLIGGATCSRVHTAVKIAPNYSGPVVYVPDARALWVCARNCSALSARPPILPTCMPTTNACASNMPTRRPPLMVSLVEARANKHQADFATYTPEKPKFIGRRVFQNYDLGELAAYIDWGPFFQTWDLAGPFPAILDDEIVGEEAKRFTPMRKPCLKKIVEGRWLTANGVIGLYPRQHGARRHHRDLPRRVTHPGADELGPAAHADRAPSS